MWLCTVRECLYIAASAVGEDCLLYVLIAFEGQKAVRVPSKGSSNSAAAKVSILSLRVHGSGLSRPWAAGRRCQEEHLPRRPNLAKPEPGLA